MFLYVDLYMTKAPNSSVAANTQQRVSNHTNIKRDPPKCNRMPISILTGPKIFISVKSINANQKQVVWC